MPLMIRLRIGKFWGAANVPSANSEMSAPPKARTCSARRLFSLGYRTSTPVPNTRDRLAFRGDRSRVRGGVDATRHAR